MGLFNLFLIPYFLFSLSPNEAADVIKDFHRKHTDALIHYVKTGDKKELSRFTFMTDRFIEEVNKEIRKKGLEKAIKKIEEGTREIIYSMHSIKRDKHYDLSFTMYYDSGDSVMYSIRKDEEDDAYRVNYIESSSGECFSIGDYIGEEKEYVEPRTKIADIGEWVKDDNYNLEFRVINYAVHYDHGTPYIDALFKVRNTEENIRYDFFDARLLDSENYRTKPVEERFYDMNDLENSTIFLGPEYSSKSVILPFYAHPVSGYSVFLLPINDKKVRIDLGEIPSGLEPE